MTFQTRRTLFYALLAVFLIGGIGLIFYSSGWRLDLETLQIDKIGGLYIETGTADASIKIGKKITPEANSLLNKGTFINGLFPKLYAIEVFKDGYQSWKKILEVRPSFVTKTLPIILIPQKPAQEVILKNVKNFWVGPNQNLAWLNGADKLFINKKLAPGNQILNWSDDGNGVLTFDNINSFYYAVDLGNNTALRLDLPVKNLQTEEPLQARMDPSDKNIIVFKTSLGIYAFDILNSKLTKIFKQPTDNLYVFHGDLIWISKKQIYSLHQNMDNQLLSKILPNAKVELSPDKEKLALKRDSGQELAVYFLKDNEALNKKSGDKTELNYLSDQPLDFGWDQTSSYLFIQYPSGLYFGEIDNRGSINLQLIANSLEKYQYDSANNALYILEAGKVYKLNLK